MISVNGNPIIPINYGYQLKLDSKKTLDAYHGMVHRKLLIEGKDAHLTRIVTNLKREYPIRGHWTSRSAVAMDGIISMKALLGIESTLLDVLLEYEMMLYKPKLEAIEGNHILYGTIDGVAIPFGEGMIVLKTIYRETLDWPASDLIKITKWPYGVHYWAKVDGEDVVINGKYKFNTEAEAKRNAKIFIERRGNK